MEEGEQSTKAIRVGILGLDTVGAHSARLFSVPGLKVAVWDQQNAPDGDAVAFVHNSDLVLGSLSSGKGPAHALGALGRGQIYLELEGGASKRQAVAQSVRAVGAHYLEACVVGETVIAAGDAEAARDPGVRLLMPHLGAHMQWAGEYPGDARDVALVLREARAENAAALAELLVLSDRAQVQRRELCRALGVSLGSDVSRMAEGLDEVVSPAEALRHMDEAIADRSMGANPVGNEHNFRDILQALLEQNQTADWCPMFESGM